MGQKEQASAPLNVAALHLIRGGFADSALTQVELSRASGIPRSTLANILSPTAEPRLIHVEQLVKIAVALGVDPRTWIGELEAIERKRTGGAAVPLARRTRERPAPTVQKRAARSRSSKPRTGDGK
jgi:transcriptional regulator with XRE-family HTH domain